MSYLILPKGYQALIDLKQTEQGIKQIKDFFSTELIFRIAASQGNSPSFCSFGYRYQ